jgi:hypothetical protein
MIEDRVSENVEVFEMEGLIMIVVFCVYPDDQRKGDYGLWVKGKGSCKSGIKPPSGVSSADGCVL